MRFYQIIESNLQVYLRTDGVVYFEVEGGFITFGFLIQFASLSLLKSAFLPYEKTVRIRSAWCFISSQIPNGFMQHHIFTKYVWGGGNSYRP